MRNMMTFPAIPHMLYTDYLDKVFDITLYPFTVESVKCILTELQYDAIAFRGTSGAALAFPLSLSLGKPLLHVRKPGSHATSKVEGDLTSKSYVIIDDFISSGKTLKLIKSRINSFYKSKKLMIPECVGIILYDSNPGMHNKNIINSIYPGVPVYYPKYD